MYNFYLWWWWGGGGVGVPVRTFFKLEYFGVSKVWTYTRGLLSDLDGINILCMHENYKHQKRTYTYMHLYK